ncbi:hypothetical protein KSP39_PZI020770 [Platanthera zijinensis]|uniref:Integrase catalytic domain-containing protein n=1 Tax=Platanthera zijinensis TaxID=2320716 RepID=A0AAP0B0D1_9ASPA
MGAISLSEQNDTNWILDSGPSHHMAKSEQSFSDMGTTSGTHGIAVGNGEILPVSCIGKVLLPTFNGPLTLPNVLCVSSLSKNLFFVHQFAQDNNCVFLLDSNDFLVKDKSTGKTLLTGRSSKGLYHITPPPSFGHALLSSHASVSTWHARLGHPSPLVLNKALSSASISTTSSMGKCHICSLSKATRLPFSLRTSASPSLLYLLHLDVWGPSPVIFNSGALYYLSVVDDFSRHVWFYPMKNKSDVFSTFILFQNYAENIFSSRVKIVQCDGGGEFLNDRFKSHLATCGISIHFSCPYTPAQNGVVERKHRHIVSMGRCLLLHSGLPHSYWAEAFSTAVFLINRLPSPVLGNLTPHHLAFGKPPDYSSLKVFGCSCFPLLPPTGRTKLMSPSIHCIFIGYSSTHKGYRCLHFPTGRIYISRHVTFDESSFPLLQPHSTLPPSRSLLVTTLTPSPYSISSLLPLPCNLPIKDVAGTVSTGSSATREWPEHPEPAAVPAAGLALPLPSDPSTSDKSSVAVTPPQPVAPPHSSSLGTGSDNPRGYRHISDILRNVKFALPHAMVACLSDNLQEPSTFKQACVKPEWRDAMLEEYHALIKNNTWTLVPPQHSLNIVGCKWVYKIKRRADGTIEHHKARLVAKGFHRRPGVDYEETYCPVVKHTTIRLILSIAHSNGWSIRQLDIRNAFLNGDLTEQVYMEHPPGFIDSSRPGYVCHLTKALYGLKQAPRAWFQRLHSFLVSEGFQSSASDSSLFICRGSNSLLVVLVYVDDLVITGSHTELVSALIASICTKFASRDLGPIEFFLGMEVARGPDRLTITQSSYAVSLLRKFNMLTCAPCSTPAIVSSLLTPDSGDPLSDQTTYRSMVGGLQYLTLTRMPIPAESQDVSLTSCETNLPLYQRDIGLWAAFSKSQSPSLIAFSDADWAGDPTTHRSISGTCVLFGGNIVSWSAKKQPTVARSSAESECRSFANATADMSWFCSLLRELGMVIPSPPLILCDNQSAIQMSRNTTSTSRSRHIDIDYHFITDLVARGALSVTYVPSSDQLADVFTKPLSKHRLRDISNKLGVCPLRLP